MKNKYIVLDSNCTDNEGNKYTNLPIELDWTKPTSKHYEGIINNQEWVTTKDNGAYTWCIAGDTLYFDIQCSTTNEDWHDNLDYYPTICKNDKYVNFRGSKFKVHEGFYKQYLSYRDVFLDLCYRDDVKKIYVAGYSLGGACTTLAIQDAVYHFSNFDKNGNIIKTNKEIFGIGYDGARCFCPDKKLKQYFDNHFIMVKTHNDPVVHCPPKFSLLPFIRFSVYPVDVYFETKVIKIYLIKVYFVKNFNCIRYMDCGKEYWIGKRFRFYPCQHNPEQIIKALKEKE